MENAESSSRYGVSMIVLKPTGVLMVRRGKAPYLNSWSFPGGGMEPGETQAEAVIRELIEETQLTVEGPVLVGEHFVTRAARGGSLTLYVFAAHWTSGDPVAGDDAAEARFFAFNAVAGLETTPKAEDWLKRARRTLEL